MTDDAWEELDTEGREFWGVFDAEGYSPDPFAIFSSKEDAEKWVAWRRSDPDEDARIRAESTVMCIRDLTGRTWNSHDDPVEPAPKVLWEEDGSSPGPGAT